MISYRELVTSIQRLGIPRTEPVVAHISLSGLGGVTGGVNTLLGALLASLDTLVMPAFTFRTMVIPEVGPPDNALVYGSGKVSNAAAEFYHQDMPVDRSVGRAAESLRRLPQAYRSSHPVLSFTGVNAAPFLQSQSLEAPLEPVRLMLDAGGWVLLLGRDHTDNASIHVAEQLAGRRQFTRWALTGRGVVECHHMPGCSQGFNAIVPRLAPFVSRTQIGPVQAEAVRLRDLVDVVVRWIKADPEALCCAQPECACCQIVRIPAARIL